MRTEVCKLFADLTKEINKVAINVGNKNSNPTNGLSDVLKIVKKYDSILTKFSHIYELCDNTIDNNIENMYIEISKKLDLEFGDVTPDMEASMEHVRSLLRTNLLQYVEINARP